MTMESKFFQMAPFSKENGTNQSSSRESANLQMVRSMMETGSMVSQKVSV